MTTKQVGGIWVILKSPSVRYPLISLLGTGFVLGVIFWGGFNTAMEVSNTEQFCITCHEMEENVYKEYRDTIHSSNRSCVRAQCPSLHVPKTRTHYIVLMFKPCNLLYLKMLTTIDTTKKTEEKSLQQHGEV